MISYDAKEIMKYYQFVQKDGYPFSECVFRIRRGIFEVYYKKRWNKLSNVEINDKNLRYLTSITKEEARSLIFVECL